MTNAIIGLIVLAAIAVLFGWLASRAWRADGGCTRWLGGLLASLFTLVFAALTVLGVVGMYKLFRTYSVSVPEVTVSGTPEQIARGEHLADVICASCHSLTGSPPLSGGENLSNDAGMPLGDIYAPNLTPGADIKEWPDADLFRAIRTGVDDAGRATAMTAVTGSHVLSDEDTLAVIAYLRNSPAVEHATPEYKPTVLMALLAGAGMIPLDVPAAVTPVTVPPEAATADYGQYVAAFMDCKSCHGQKLDGNVPPPYPAGPNLQADLSAWSKDQFVEEIRIHATSAGPGVVMPWKDMAQLDDIELEALYLYLHQTVSK